MDKRGAALNTELCDCVYELRRQRGFSFVNIKYDLKKHSLFF